MRGNEHWLEYRFRADAAGGFQIPMRGNEKVQDAEIIVLLTVSNPQEG